jgi:hypothetical protein
MTRTAVNYALKVIYLGLNLCAGAALAQDRPLLIEGTQSIYQRVLTRPDAVLFDNPEGTEQDVLPAFQPLYVYSRENDWMAVGPSSRMGATGYLRVADSVDWRRNIVASFTNAAGRNRQVMFADRAQLQALMSHEALPALQVELVAQADRDAVDPATGVVAVEPSEFVDIRERLYLMPILDYAEDLHPSDYSPVLMMEIASLPLAEAGAMGGGEPDNEFEAGVIFVIDTTQSMEPYIRGTREAVAAIIDGISQSDVGTRVHFGGIGYRDNNDLVPGLEYRTSVIHPLSRSQPSETFLGALDATGVATVSSVGFNEDAFAGVEDAIVQTDWDQDGAPFGGRYVVLVTDAGPKDPNDPNARSDIGARELQVLAEENGIALMTLHLQTSGGASNHAYAEARYRELSRYGDLSFYFPIPDGDEIAFETQVGTLVASLTDHVRVAVGQAPATTVTPADDLEALGLAMRLRFLGQKERTEAPDVIRAWVADRALEDPTRSAITPRLLLTRNELSSMTTILQEVLTLAEATQGADDPSMFFRQVQDAVARLAVNPDLVVNTGFETLGGAVGEFLQGLPYRSQIMDLTEDRWINAGTERREIIDGLRQKLSLYRQIHNDPANWTALYDSAPDGEHVYAMPFSVLP